jgi:hypothetical protein
MAWAPSAVGAVEGRNTPASVAETSTSWRTGPPSVWELPEGRLGAVRPEASAGRRKKPASRQRTRASRPPLVRHCHESMGCRMLLRAELAPQGALRVGGCYLTSPACGKQ